MDSFMITIFHCRKKLMAKFIITIKNMTLVSTFNDHICQSIFGLLLWLSSHIESLKYLDLESVQASYSQILAGDKVNVSENRSVTHFLGDL